jgi:hypothetical protein
MSFFEFKETRSAEVMSAVLAIALALSTFTSGASAPVNVALAGVLPEWAILNIVTALFCLTACFFDRSKRVVKAARFLSGCFWGTVVMVFANTQQWLPVFWMAVVMFAFDIYLVAVKGQTWKRVNSSTPHG